MDARYAIELKGLMLKVTRTASSATEALAICKRELLTLTTGVWVEVTDRQTGAVVSPAELTERASNE